MRDNNFYLLTRATKPRQGYFYEFDKDIVKRIADAMSHTSSAELVDIGRNLKQFEKAGLWDRDINTRADYLIQLLKILGRAKFLKKEGRRLLYQIR